MANGCDLNAVIGLSILAIYFHLLHDEEVEDVSTDVREGSTKPRSWWCHCLHCLARRFPRVHALRSANARPILLQIAPLLVAPHAAGDFAVVGKSFAA